MSRRVAGFLVGVLFASSVAASPAAAQPPVPLSDYLVTSWTMKDGLPSDVIWTIAQDHSGYLWLGTNGGLVRFDGVQFVTYDEVGGAALPKVPVRSLFVSNSGDLWVGYSFSENGGISRIHGDSVRTYGERDGLTRGTVNALIADATGTLWAGTNTALFRLDGDHWQQVGLAAGIPAARVDSLYIDRHSDLLVGTSAGVFRRSGGATGFSQVDSPDDTPPVFRGFSEDRGGRIWVTDPVGGFRILGDRATGMRDRGRGNTLLHDREGSLWVTTMGEGIWRISNAGSRDRRVEKAHAPGARAIFEDRDGQIWAGNGDGLLRLARPKITPFTDLGLVYGVETTADGAVWATTPDSVLRASVDGQRAGFREELRQPGIRTLRTDKNGNLWVATSTDLVRFGADRRVFSLPRGAGLNRISAIAADSSGGLWISDRDRGLFSWSPSTPNVITPFDALSQRRLSTMFADSSDRLWFAATDGQVGVIERGGAIHLFDAADGLGPGPFNSFYEDSRHAIWIAGNDGIHRFTGSRFAKINQGNRFRGSVGIVEDEDGDLWLGTSSGIACITRADLDKAAADPRYEVFARVFDAADGLAGMPVNFGNPTEARLSDGRLWFVTGRGLSAFDPRTLKASARPTVAHIEHVDIDGRPAAFDGTVQVPAGTTRVAIDYSVLDLTTPWRTRFRYRLDSVDTSWIEAGVHRQAVYTGLPPGTHLFRVQASNVDGSWNETTAEMPLQVAPVFYQRYSFYGACVALVGLCTWGAWQLRVRRIRRQFAMLIGERARVSREIHDTLLQSLVGVALQFDALASNFDAASPERQQLVRIRKQVEEYIREARHSIWNLRAPVIGARDLVTWLNDAALRGASGQPVEVAFDVVGTPFPCGADTEEQLVRICQEAVLNAVRHAKAAHVHVELRYEPDAVVLRVTDDGLGFDPEAVVPFEAAGHYGLAGMRERAAQLGGFFTLKSAMRAGTSIEARIPVGACAS